MSDDSGGALEWSPAAGLVAAAWVAALAAAAWCVALSLSGADPAGRLIAGIATAGLVVGAAFSSRARPRLRADADGLTVGGFLRARHHPWPFVQSVRLLRVRRWGRETSLVEVETVTAAGHERLLLFGRLELAADPEDVVPILLALRP